MAVIKQNRERKITNFNNYFQKCMFLSTTKKYSEYAMLRDLIMCLIHSHLVRYSAERANIFIIDHWGEWLFCRPHPVHKDHDDGLLHCHYFHMFHFDITFWRDISIP